MVHLVQDARHDIAVAVVVEEDGVVVGECLIPFEVLPIDFVDEMGTWNENVLAEFDRVLAAEDVPNLNTKERW